MSTLIIAPNNGRVTTNLVFKLVRNNIWFSRDTLTITSVGARTFTETFRSTVGAEPIINALQPLEAILIGTMCPLDTPNVDKQGFTITSQGWEWYDNSTWTAIDELLVLAEHDGTQLRYFAENECGRTTTEPITLNTKTEEVAVPQTSHSNWVLYPNPARELIYITGEKIEMGTIIKIYNANGTHVMNHTVNAAPLVINIAGLPDRKSVV